MYKPYNPPYDGSRNLIRNFDSLPAMVKYFKTIQANFDRSWSGDSNHTATLALNGDESLVPMAEKLIDKLDASIESVGQVWKSDVFGQVINVPSYLADISTPFRRIVNQVSDVSPVRIFVGIVCSGGISQQAMQERGVTIMALVMALQAIRPVEVILYHETEIGDRDSLYTIPLESRPVSLAHTINALANVYVARDLTYSIAYSDGFQGGWPKGYSGGKPTANYQEWRAKVLGITEQDILIESTYITDEILTNPVKWINSHLSLYSIPE
jgi:hypothetical protein